MALNETDITYRDSARARIATRAWIAVLAGIFASWFWLFVITAIWAAMEFVTMHKVLAHPVSLSDEEYARLYTEKERRLNSARAMGQALVGALAAWASVIALAAIIKGIKILVLRWI